MSYTDPSYYLNMSVTHCALSGQPLLHPIVCIRTGLVFERDTVLKHVEATGRCPITGAELTTKDFIELQVNPAVKPRPMSAASIPGLLESFQTEWDTMVLEQQRMKKHMDQLRQELSHALYQNDAATRVVARLLKEREELRSELAQYQSS